MKISTRQLVESALMIAVGTVLSIIKFNGPWALGGSVTACSMLPLVLISHRYGTRAGVFAAFAYSILQLFLGMHNVQYATSAIMAIGIVLLDYVIAYTIIGLSAMFTGVVKHKLASILLGIACTFTMRFACHFLSGWWIWEVLWPNERGWAAPIWSLAYNASYMGPELVITAAVCILLYKPLKPYWSRESIK